MDSRIRTEFINLVQDFLEDVAPLISMQLGGPTLDGLSMLFDQYVDMLIKAIPSPGEEDEGGAENGDDRKVGILEARYS